MVMVTREQSTPAARAATVYIVDADAGVRSGLRSLLQTLDVKVETFRSAEEFLRSFSVGIPGCLITEVQLPGMSGLELQEQLRALRVDLPVIVLATDADVQSAVRAMHLGALDFVEKPFVERVVLSRVQQALCLDRSTYKPQHQ